MAACTNPECRNGLVPGVRTGGYGTHDGARPIIDASGRSTIKMTWQPIPCPLCRPSEKGPRYQPVARTEDEIADRWDLASRRAPYIDPRTQPKKPPQQPAPDQPNQQTIKEPILAGDAVDRLCKAVIAAQSAVADTVGGRIADALEKMLARIELLTGAVLELCEAQAHPLVEVSTEPAPPDTQHQILGLLQQLLDNARLASHPVAKEPDGCATAKEKPTVTGETTKSSGRSRAKMKGNSARKRGGTAAESTE